MAEGSSFWAYLSVRKADCIKTALNDFGDKSQQGFQFANLVLPEQKVLDNGQQFVADEFKKFRQVLGINHTNSVPYNPTSNGEARGEARGDIQVPYQESKSKDNNRITGKGHRFPCDVKGDTILSDKWMSLKILVIDRTNKTTLLQILHPSLKIHFFRPMIPLQIGYVKSGTTMSIPKFPPIFRGNTR